MMFVLLVTTGFIFAAIHVSEGVRSTTDFQDPNRFTSKKFVSVHGHRMAYVEVETGDPILFLHGNPTSSFLWRKVLPYVEGQGRIIVPDLIGFGDSAKLPPHDSLRYSAFQHLNFLTTFLEKVEAKAQVTLVLHDWGSMLGFTWAYYNRFNPKAVKGIAFMEAIIKPVNSSERSDIANALNPYRAEGNEDLILQKNEFIEKLLPMAIARNLTTAEMKEYRRPFKNAGEDRRPMLTFVRQFPIDNKPADVAQVVADYADWLPTTKIPKLFVRGKPGSLINNADANLVRSWPSIIEFSVRGFHFIQEDSGEELGEGLSKWLKSL